MRNHATSAAVSTPAKYAFIAMAVGWLSLVICGGSSRADTIQLIPMRVVTAAMVGVMVWVTPQNAFRSVRTPLLFLLSMALFVSLQLIPLPYALWTTLPGRSLYADALESAAIGPIWHPLTLAPDLTWNSLLALLPPLLFVLGAACLNALLRRLLFIGLFVTILFSGFLGLLQVAAGPDTALRFYAITNVDSGVGLFANRNHQAVFLAMGIPIAGWMAVRMTSRGQRVLGLSFAGSAIIFLLTAGFASQSRMGSAIIILSLILTAIMSSKPRQGAKKLVTVLAITIAVTLVISAIAIRDWAPGRLAFSQDVRVKIFPETIAAAKTFFPVGAGFGTFPIIFPRFETLNDLQPEYFNHAHVEPTELVIEGGILALLLVALFLAWYLRSAFRVWWQRDTSDDIVLDARLCSILIALPFVASLTDYPIRSPLMLCTLASMASILHRLSKNTRSDGRQRHAGRG